MNKKIFIISDKNKRSNKIKKIVKLFFVNKSFKNLNIIIVIGGDGFMLQTLKKYKDTKKFFYGINSGSYGFLMNKFSKKSLINLPSTKRVCISPLEMTVISKKKRERF